MLENTKRYHKRINCPGCGMELILLNEDEAAEEKRYEFWCNNCNLDITIEEDGADV